MRSIFINSRNIDCVRFNLTLIRHGETHANADGIIQGALDTELSNIGYLQAKSLGRYLQYHRFSHIYSSDLKRASETARPIYFENRVSSCEIKFDSLLRERNYGIAQGQTRQWLHELAKENGVPYSQFTPTGAETSSQVRERGIIFFQKLCQELFSNFGPSNLLANQKKSSLARSATIGNFLFKNSISMENLSRGLINHINIRKSYHSSIDSGVDLLSDQQSISSLSSSSSFDKQQNSIKTFCSSAYENHSSDLDVLIITHGAIIRELIKYFVYDLQTDIGKYIDTIQDLAPNTSITRFQVTYSINKQSIPKTTLKLIDYHNKTHLINNETNLDVINKCSL